MHIYVIVNKNHGMCDLVYRLVTINLKIRLSFKNDFIYNKIWKLLYYKDDNICKEPMKLSKQFIDELNPTLLKSDRYVT